MNTLVFAILFVVCFSFANSQLPAEPNNFVRPSGYFLPKTFQQTVIEVGVQVEINIGAAAFLPNGPADLCNSSFLALWNLDLPSTLTDLEGKLAAKGALIAQNTEWSSITDDTARFVDTLQVKADSNFAMSNAIRIREISRGAMYAKIVTSTSDEMSIVVEEENYEAAGKFQQFVSSGFPTIKGDTCVDLLPAVASFLTGAQTSSLTPLLLGVKSRAAVIGEVAANFTPAAFAYLYTRKLALLEAADAVTAIAEDFIADARIHFFEKVNLTVHKLVDFIENFGDDTVNGADAVAGTLRYNVIRRIRDLIDDAFDRVVEVDDVIDVVIIKTLGDLNTSGYYTFNVTVSCVNNTNYTAIGEKLVAFLQGFVQAYSHPIAIDIVSSTKIVVDGAVQWRSVVKAVAALDVEFDPRDLTGDKPTIDVTPQNTPDDSTNAEYTDAVQNYNVKPAEVAVATLRFTADLAANATALALAKAQLDANLTAYGLLAIFDFSTINTQIQTFTTDTFSLVNLRLKAIAAGLEVKKAHLQLVAKVKSDLAAQWVAARNVEILAINLKLQLITAVANYNATNRTGCNNSWIPDWRLETTTTDDCYNLTKIPACRPVAGLIAQLLIIKNQLLTAISIKTAVNAKIQTLNNLVAQIDANYTAYANAILTAASDFQTKKATASLVAAVTTVDFKASIEACVKTVANGTLDTVTYVQTAGASANVYVHTINVDFNVQATASLSITDLKNRLAGSLQLCLSIHIGGDLSYFSAVPSATVPAKRSVFASQPSSQVTTDFNNNSTTTGGNPSSSTSGSLSTSTTGSAVTGTSTTGAGALTFSVVIAFASMIVAMFL